MLSAKGLDYWLRHRRGSLSSLTPTFDEGTIVSDAADGPELEVFPNVDNFIGGYNMLNYWY